MSDLTIPNAKYPQNYYLAQQRTAPSLIKSDWDSTEIVFIRHGESFNNCIYETVRQRFGETLTHEEFENEINKLHDPDCGLSPKGLRQAQALGEYLKEHSLEMIKDIHQWKIYSSPMHRCLLTALEVSKGFQNKSVFVHPKLFESDGCYRVNSDGTTEGLRGMSKEEVEERFPHFSCLPGMEAGWFQLNHKETRKEFYERTLQAVDFLWQEHEKIHYSNVNEKDCEHSELDDVAAPICPPTTSNEQKQEGLIIVAHGNIIASTISFLLNTNALIANCNTGMSHIQLWTHRVTKQKLVSLVSTNRIPHFSKDPSLHGGELIFEDHWIQEFLANEST